MKHALRVLLLAPVLIAATCGRSSSDDDEAPPAPPGPPPPVNITGPGASLEAAYLGVAIAPVTFTATGTPPITWAVTGGTLTPGLSLSANGVLTGAPTAVGTFNFTVTATDPNGTDSGGFSQVVGTSVSESEPNDSAATADVLPVGVRATGAITSDDVDFWSFSGSATQIVKVELFAIRRDHAAWDANGNRPRVNLIGPDGTLFLVGHDYDSAGAAGWTWGDHDLDIPLFRIPAAGTYYVRVDSYLAATPGGSYALAVTDVTPGVLQAETETNDDAASASFITPGMIRGVRVDDNDDFYSFNVTQPTLVHFELTAYRNGVFGASGSPDDDYFDPVIELIDTDGSTVMSTNYRVFFHDPAIHFHLVTSGIYFLRVTESVTGSDGDGDYYINFTATPVGSVTETESNDDDANANPIAYGDVVSGTMSGDEDWFSFTGSAGDLIRVFWFDFGSSQQLGDFVNFNLAIAGPTLIQAATTTTGVNGMNCLRAILPADGTYFLRVTLENGPTPYTFQLVQFMTSAYETEANDTPATANAIPGAGRVSGAIDSTTDVDVFSFSAEAGEVVTFSIYAGPGSSSFGFPSHARVTTLFAALLPDLEVLNAGSTVLGDTPYAGVNFSGESVANGLATSELTFVAPSTGTFYLRVSASDGNGDADHLYVLEKR